jgi:hypothetical protein
MRSPIHDPAPAFPRLRRAKALIALGAVAVAFTAAGPADAEPKKPDPGANLSCSLQWSWGITYYPPGSKITVKRPDGLTDTYECDGATGKWKRVRTASAPTITYIPVQDGMTIAAPR